MQPIHHLLDAGIPVPPVHVKDVDVRGAQLLETGLQTEMHRFDVVSDIVRLLGEGLLATLEVGGELQIWVSKRLRNFRGAKNRYLGRYHKLIPDVALFSPFSDENLRRLVLTAKR
jgi:hypothetical protein